MRRINVQQKLYKAGKELTTYFFKIYLLFYVVKNRNYDFPLVSALTVIFNDINVTPRFGLK